MIITGMQKLSMLDFPGHTATTIFTSGCDFRCPYCHNSYLACGLDKSMVSFDELFNYLNAHKGIIDGVAITGGEPLLQPGLKFLMKDIKDAGFLVKLDTNGYHPDKLCDCIEAGVVDYVAMDVKSDLMHYPSTAFIKPEEFKSERITESINLLWCLRDCLSEGYELRTTIVKEFHQDPDINHDCHIFNTIAAMVSDNYLHNVPRYTLQKFVSRDSCFNPDLTPPDDGYINLVAEIMKEVTDDLVIK